MEDEYYNFLVNPLLSLKAILFVLMGLQMSNTFYDAFFSLLRTSSLYEQDISDASNLVLHHFGWSCEMITIKIQQVWFKYAFPRCQNIYQFLCT